MPFKKGQSGNPNGKSNPGRAGRPADWLREKCQKLVDQHKIIEFLADVAGGKPVVRLVVIDQNSVQIPAEVKDRIKAAEILMDRGYGKTPQAIDVTQVKSKEEIEAENKRFERLYSFLGSIPK